MRQLSGIITALLTPLKENGEFSVSGMETLVEHCISEGMSGLFTLGSAGEFSSFSEDEKSRIIDVVIEQNGGRIPVIAGCGAPSTEETLRLCHMACKKDIDAVSVITPFFICPTQDDLLEHYRRVAEESSKPVIVYNFPGRTGVSLTVDTVARIKELRNIVGIKDSSGSLEFFRRLMCLKDDSFEVICGMDAIFYEAAEMGCKTMISAPSNVIGKQEKKMLECIADGRIDEAATYRENILSFKELLSTAPAPTIVKQAANLAGLPVGGPRAPLRLPDAPTTARLEALLHEKFSDCMLA